MSEIIIHHYPPSPVAEKIRTAMGFKKLSWQSVEQNRLPERPELFAMTGGYRRIPVMQIGADIFCDTQCIFRELERLVPQPTLFPSGSNGMPFAVSRWTDGPLFELAVRAAFAPVADSLAAELVADRTRLYFGPDGDMAKEAKDMPHTLAQLRAQLGWLDERLSSGRDYLLGDQPGMPDLLAWSVVWFVHGRYTEAESFLSEFPALLAWAGRMKAIGHGTSTDITPKQALEVAKGCAPQTEEQSDPLDPQGIKPGMPISVEPLTDSAEQAITGIARAINRNTIAITREHDLCGEVAVHFPRVGFRVTVL